MAQVSGDPRIVKKEHTICTAQGCDSAAVARSLCYRHYQNELFNNRLTPAYDIDPRPRLGREANQAMVVNGDDRRALIATAIAGAGQFGLRTDEAVSIAKGQIQSIRANFRRVATEAGISIDLQNLLAGRAFLNSYVFEGAPAELPVLDAPL